MKQVIIIIGLWIALILASPYFVGLAKGAKKDVYKTGLALIFKDKISNV